MIEKISPNSPKESEKETVVPGEIYAVSSDIRNVQGEILKVGSPVQILQEPKEERVVVKDFRGVQWDAGSWQLSKKAIQEMPARGRVWLSRTKIRLYSFFKAVDRNSWFIIWGSGCVFGCIYLPTYLYFITMSETTAPIPLPAFMVAIAWFFFCLPCIFAEDVALRLFPDADDLVCKKENLRELEVLLEAQKADVGKESKNDK